MPEAFDAVIVGGGVIGLSLADRWLSRRPADRVLVVEKESSVAMHASGRNSGVLHAGFYYSPDSLKARLTKSGNALLKALIVEEDLPLRTCGKVVVASDEAQLSRLDTLANRAVTNGVDVEMVNEAQLRGLEPLARTVDRALFSPTTAVSDPIAVTEALAKRVLRRGGTVALGEEVLSAAPGRLTSNRRRLHAGHVINAAGLYADRVARQFGYCDDYRMLPFKGLYWYGSWPSGRLSRHVYPVPDPANPFLGVHLTVTADGRTKIGPTALPALWREDYGGVANFSAREAKEIAGLYPAFLTSPHHRAWTLVRSEVPKYSRHLLVSHARRLVPSALAADFRLRGRPGVRAQLFHLPSRQLEMDFVVRGDAQSTHILNAVSPAWTSALAFAGYVMDDIEGRGG
jgi:L-2-hydroxyglutarate oxidase LhgO